MRKHLYAFGFAILITFGVLYALTQQSFNPGRGTDVLNVANQFVTFNPVDFGVNAITLPISGTTANSTTIDMRGVKGYTLMSACGQIYNINVRLIQEDGTTVFQTVSPVNNVPTTGAVTFFGTTPGSASGGGFTTTAGTAAGAIAALPLRAVAFSFTNTTASASTCTARLFLQY